MTTIGHNNPPASDVFAIHMEELFSTVSGSTAGECTTDEQEAALDQLLDEVRQTIKDANAKRVEEKKPHDDAAKAVQAKWKPNLDKLTAAANEIKAKLTPYRVARQAAKDEEARKAREAAEAKERAAQEALKQSDDLEGRFAAEAQLKEAAKLKAGANKIDRAPTGIRTTQTAVVSDYRAALLWVAKNDQAALNEFLDEYARKRGAPFDGVVMKTERKAA